MKKKPHDKERCMRFFCVEYVVQKTRRVSYFLPRVMIRQNQTDGRIFGTRLDASFVSCRQRGTDDVDDGRVVVRSTVRPFNRSFVYRGAVSCVLSGGCSSGGGVLIRFDSIRFDSSVGLIQLLQLINFRQRVSRFSASFGRLVAGSVSPDGACGVSSVDNII